MNPKLPQKDDGNDAQLSAAGRFLKNIKVSLSASGAAAVLIAWLIAVVVITIWASEALGRQALYLLAFFGGALFLTLGLKLR